MLTRLKSAAADEVFKVDHAQTGRSDLIVIGNHGRTASRTCSWEASRKAVLRRAPCPVSTVKDVVARAKEDRPKAAKASGVAISVPAGPSARSGISATDCGGIPLRT